MREFDGAPIDGKTGSLGVQAGHDHTDPVGRDPADGPEQAPVNVRCGVPNGRLPGRRRTGYPAREGGIGDDVGLHCWHRAPLGDQSGPGH